MAESAENDLPSLGGMNGIERVEQFTARLPRRRPVLIISGLDEAFLYEVLLYERARRTGIRAHLNKIRTGDTAGPCDPAGARNDPSAAKNP